MSQVNVLQENVSTRFTIVIIVLSPHRHYMTHAVAAYEDKPRDQWLFDYPAQVSLCGTQIW